MGFWVVSVVWGILPGSLAREFSLGVLSGEAEESVESLWRVLLGSFAKKFYQGALRSLARESC